MGLLVARLGTAGVTTVPAPLPASRRLQQVCGAGLLFFLLFMTGSALAGRGEKSRGSVSFDFPVPAARLAQIVGDVSRDTIIRGTFEYAKEKVLSGATPATSSNAFPPWNGPGQVFYKIRQDAVAPAHFLDTGDIGGVTVRYVVEPLTEQTARLHIEAIFIENGRRRRHPSDGTVETAEFGEISRRLKAIQQEEQEKRQLAEDKEREQREALTQLQATLAEEKAGLDTATASLQQLNERAASLRRKVLMRLKTSGVPLKAAPYNHAATLQILSRSEVVTVQIRTPYWLGVERKGGQRGWVYHLFLEAVP